MATLESKIEGALFYRVFNMALDPPLRIAWPNEDFEPNGQTYLVVDHMPNQTDRLFLGSNDPQRRQGILQITVRGKLSERAIVFTEIAGQVAAHFPTDLPMRREGITVKVTKAPSIAPALVDGPNWSVPVSINYECFA